MIQVDWEEDKRTEGSLFVTCRISQAVAWTQGPSPQADSYIVSPFPKGRYVAIFLFLWHCCTRDALGERVNVTFSSVLDGHLEIIHRSNRDS